MLAMPILPFYFEWLNSTRLIDGRLDVLSLVWL